MGTPRGKCTDISMKHPLKRTKHFIAEKRAKIVEVCFATKAQREQKMPKLPVMERVDLRSS